MARNNFYYQNEAAAVTGAAAFARAILASPESFGISPEMAASFAAQSDALTSAYDLSSNPSTRTMGAVAGKNAALRAMRQGAMRLSRILYATPTVSDQQLVEVGLLPRATRTPVAGPADAPALRVVAVSGRLVSVHVREANSTRRGMAPGARGANLYSFVGDRPPVDPRDYHFEALTTRARTQITFSDTTPSGATVWLSACWVSTRGQTSPCSSPVSFTLQGGSALPATG